MYVEYIYEKLECEYRASLILQKYELIKIGTNKMYYVLNLVSINYQYIKIFFKKD